MTNSHAFLRPTVAAVFVLVGFTACGGPKGDQARKGDEGLPPGPVVTTHETGLAADTLAEFLNPFFVPYNRALYLTSQGDPAAGAVLDSAHAAWAAFAARAPKVYTDDVKWSARRDDVETALTHAVTLLRRGDAKAAHLALEPVRLHLSDQNHEVGIVAWPDLLLAFHEPMEELVVAENAQFMRSRVVALRLALSKLGGYPLGRFTAGERERMGLRLNQIAVELDSVEISMGETAADLAEPHRHAMQLKKAFVDLYTHSRY